MLTQYSNINEILEAPSSISARRFTITDQNTFLRNPQQFLFGNVLNDHNTEFHVYAGEDWITGKHNLVDISPETNNIIDNNDNVFPTNYLKKIDIFQQFLDLKLTSGNYRFIINFFENKIGSFETPAFVIDKIAPNKQEIRLR